MNDADVTVKGTVALSFAELVSVWSGTTVAVADVAPGTVGSSTTVTVAEAPLASVPSAQVAWPRTPLHEPLVVAIEKNVAFDGYVSVSPGERAVSGPWFVTWKTRLSCWPGSTGDGDAVPVTPRSTLPVTLHAVNADVSMSPWVGFPMVSVPVTAEPAGIAGTVAESVPLPEVMSTGKRPRKTAPSPPPDGSHSGFSYSCTFTVAPGTPLSVPAIVEVAPLVETPVSASEPVNGTSFSMPRPPLFVIEFP